MKILNAKQDKEALWILNGQQNFVCVENSIIWDILDANDLLMKINIFFAINC